MRIRRGILEKEDTKDTVSDRNYKEEGKTKPKQRPRRRRTSLKTRSYKVEVKFQFSGENDLFL